MLSVHVIITIKLPKYLLVMINNELKHLPTQDISSVLILFSACCSSCGIRTAEKPTVAPTPKFNMKGPSDANA